MNIESMYTGLYNLVRPEKFKHMTHISPDMDIAPPDTEGRRVISWQGEQIHVLKSNRQLHNKHGGPCFLIATGPSIKQCDLGKIRNFPVFGVNGALKILEPANITPDYYMINDVNFFREHFDVVKKVMQATPPIAFFRPRAFLTYATWTQACSMARQFH